MKKIILATSILLLASCSASTTNQGVESAPLPSNFERVDLDKESLATFSHIYEVRHKETGCHYIFYDGTEKGGVTPMYKADGKPYCTGGANNE